ncbi:hypothetical protein [Pyrobaculum ferrireducens]|uniref:Uncharacterized protein n=1 Tax=Pyrobaculum ferrireducens TaxID=1104324 RepID=G7VHE8_9CREN|nr:hypothetical protein [Pyrobaculum ferrireducens]AET33239.1 hypothetical protein P186_1834 [Pyrobaculum ferrireducens]
MRDIDLLLIEDPATVPNVEDLWKDLELDRIIELASTGTNIRKGDYVLMDESFSSTNHVEASLVAYDVVSALVDSGIFVWYVTFLYDFTRKFLDRYSEHSVLLTP